MSNRRLSRAGTLDALLKRLEAKQVQIDAGGWGGFAQLVESFHDPYRFLHLATVALIMKERNANTLKEWGRGEESIAKSDTHYLNRAAAFRERAVMLFKAQRDTDYVNRVAERIRRAA